MFILSCHHSITKKLVRWQFKHKTPIHSVLSNSTVCTAEGSSDQRHSLRDRRPGMAWLPAQLTGRWGQIKWNSVWWGKKFYFVTGRHKYFSSPSLSQFFNSRQGTSFSSISGCNQFSWLFPHFFTISGSLRALRIQDVYPGSRILIFVHPGSRIPDLGSRIPDPKIATKERGEKKLLSSFFL